MVLVARVALWTAGARAARRATRVAACAVGRCDATRAPWAVSAIGRRVTGATCLTQALALQALLERTGHPCRVEIGVARADRFEAHAWVVCGDRIVLGDTGVARFHTVTTFE
jgi:hypothetical protein